MTTFKYFFRNRHVHRISLTMVLICLWLLQSCKPAEPIKIGFTGGLTGRVADLGIAGRDGVILAFEEINEAGGINGRPVSLIIKDDKQDAAIAKNVVKDLISEGVAAIIGHMTSSMSIASIPIINESKVLMLSPTTSTNSLTGLDDYFFRVYSASTAAAKRLAGHVFKDMNIRKITVIYDTGNRAYTESMYDHFKKAYEAYGGKVISAVTYKSDPEIQFLELAKEISATKSEGFFILANAIDTATLCQQLYKIGKLLPIVAGEWSATEEILEFGGKAVEGVRFFHTFNKRSNNANFLKFQKTFKKRFNAEAGFASVHAYDAAQVIIKSLQHNNNVAALKDTIKKIETFSGLQGELTFDNYGDVTRELFLMTIQGNRFQPVK